MHSVLLWFLLGQSGLSLTSCSMVANVLRCFQGIKGRKGEAGEPGERGPDVSTLVHHIASLNENTFSWHFVDTSQKIAMLCFVLLPTFVIHAVCHAREAKEHLYVSYLYRIDLTNMLFSFLPVDSQFVNVRRPSLNGSRQATDLYFAQSRSYLWDVISQDFRSYCVCVFSFQGTRGAKGLLGFRGEQGLRVSASKKTFFCDQDDPNIRTALPDGVAWGMGWQQSMGCHEYVWNPVALVVVKPSANMVSGYWHSLV